MVTSKNHHRRTKHTRRIATKKRRNNNKKKSKRSHQWHQKGCQSGGGSMMGGVAWAPSDLNHQTTGNVEPYAANGNHYALNNEILARPQNSNHLVEKGLFGGGSKRKYSRRQKYGKKNNHRKFIGEQRGGMARLFPELINSAIGNTIEIPKNISTALQGSSTSFVTSNATDQPIGKPLQI